LAIRRIAAGLLTLLLQSCDRPGVLVAPNPRSLPMPAGIEVAFNQRRDATYRSPIREETRTGDDLEALILRAITGARQEVLVAVQELSLPRVAEALVAKHRAGLRVEVVLENTYSTPWSQEHAAGLSPHLRLRRQQLMALADRNRDGRLSPEETERGDAVLILQRGGVPLIDDRADGSAGSSLMHSKYLVADGRVVVTGSANFTPSCIHGDPDDRRSRGNVNHLLRLDSAELAERFREDFATMWGDGPGGQPDSRFGLNKRAAPPQEVMVGNSAVRVLFAPQRRDDPHHGLQVLAEILATAQRRIDLALFVFSAQELTSVLAERQRHGVKIRLMADPGFANRSFSEVLDLLGVAMADRDCRLEAGNQPIARPLAGVGTPRLPGGDKLHHKFAVIDNRTVITGSFNWSPSAAHQNDEVLLVIDSPLLAAHFTHEMDRLWQGVELGITQRLQRKLARSRQRCGSGVQRK
jgi:phosphatidylserine/phosphatidylglycerophosphate/cardiolipin synthase-like enzyme